MPTETYQTLDLASVRSELSQLHEQVTNGRQRVEIKRDGSDETCVIISKAELEGLERALQILSETDAYKAMSDSLAQLLSTTEERFAST